MFQNYMKYDNPSDVFRELFTRYYPRRRLRDVSSRRYVTTPKTRYHLRDILETSRKVVLETFQRPSFAHWEQSQRNILNKIGTIDN